MATGEAVEIAGIIAPQNDHLGSKILQGKAKRVKLDGTQVITSKLAHGNKILHDIG